MRNMKVHPFPFYREIGRAVFNAEVSREIEDECPRGWSLSGDVWWSASGWETELFNMFSPADLASSSRGTNGTTLFLLPQSSQPASRSAATAIRECALALGTRTGYA